MTPDGICSVKIANPTIVKENLLIICGHYKGIDERIRQHYITMEISIGDSWRFKRAGLAKTTPSEHRCNWQTDSRRIKRNIC